MMNPIMGTVEAQSQAARRRVMILEDDDIVRRSLQLMLAGHGFDAKAHRSSVSLLADPDVEDAMCLVADYCLKDTDGITVLECLRARGWVAPAILVTAYGSHEVSARASKAGFATVIEKPFKDHALVNALNRLV